MHPSRVALPCFLWLAACATPTRVVSPFDDTELSFAQLADTLATADVVVLGEEHGVAAVHEAHWGIVRDLYDRRPELILSLEMFERDVQSFLWQYVSGDLDEAEFLAKARPWPDYRARYRPLVEFARSHGLEVIAANAPAQAVKSVAKSGLAALPASRDVARSTSAPEDDYWLAFKAEMEDHVGTDSEDKMWRSYEAQCLRDDTMAEAIADRMKRARDEGKKPLLVHVCGRFHSDHRRGTVQRLMAREPELRVKTLSVESVPEGSPSTIGAAPTLADYVLLVPREPEEDASAMPPVATSPAPATPSNAPAAPSPAPAGAGAAASASPAEGGRPGLGLRPDYEAGVRGCAVADVTPGGAAERAGIQAGDVIVQVGDEAVEDVASYAEALDALTVGQSTHVTVQRGDKTLRLPVVVGRRSR